MKHIHSLLKSINTFQKLDDFDFRVSHKLNFNRTILVHNFTRSINYNNICLS